MHQLKNEPTKRYGIACNPLSNIYHVFELETNQTLSTGQPVVVYADTKEEAYDLLFSEWTETEDGELDTYTARPMAVSTDYTEEDSNDTCSIVMDEIDGVKVRGVKHPDKDEWAVFFSQHIFSKAKQGPRYQELVDKHINKVQSGKHKDKDTAKNEGWK